jgi:hypothetical protein
MDTYSLQKETYMLSTSKIWRIEAGLMLLMQRQFVEDEPSDISRSLSNNR